MNNSRIFLTTFMLALLFKFTSCDNSSVDPPNPPIPSDVFDWSIQISETGESYTDVYFVNSSIGWAVGSDVLAATADGGRTWPLAPGNSSGSNGEQFNSVFFINAQKGWIVGSGDDNTTGRIFVSEQGGAYPSLQGTFSSPLNAVFFLNDLTGWAGGDNGQLVFTNDGGFNWSQLTGLDDNIYDVHFTTSEKGWAVGDNGALYSTTDGLNFHLRELGTTQPLNAVHFTDTLNGWICGNRNTIYRRYLNDQSQIMWASVSIPEGSITDWNDIQFIDPLNGWVVGSGANVFKTSDGGVSWTRQTSAANGKMNAIHMTSSTRGWIAGDHGTILTYTP